MKIQSDLLLALRQLHNRPIIFTSVVLSLGLGIGARLTFFRLANELYLKELPVPDPGSLVSIYTYDQKQSDFLDVSFPDYLDFATALQSRVNLAAFTRETLNWNRGTNSELVVTDLVTSNYMEILAPKVIAGRSFARDDFAPGRSAVAIISGALWETAFGLDPAVIGKSLFLNGRHFQIIGILHREFAGTLRMGKPPAVFLPLSEETAAGIPGLRRLMQQRGERSFLTIGRMASGIRQAEVESTAAALAQRLSEQFPNSNARLTTRLRSGAARQLWPSQDSAIAASLLVFNICLGSVLIVACGNVASLLVGLMSLQQRDLAIRMAIGARTWQLVRHPLLLAAVLSSAGVGAGFAVAAVCQELLQRSDRIFGVPVYFDFATDWRVAAFTLAVAVVLTLACALLPSVAVGRVGVLSVLHAADRLGSRRLQARHLSSWILGIQGAVAMALLLTCLSLVRSVLTANSVGSGYAEANIASLLIDADAVPLAKTDALPVFGRLRRELSALPGVTSVTLSALSPSDPSHIPISAFLPGTAAKDAGVPAEMNIVGPDYFQTLGVPLLAGRELGDADTASSPPVAVISAGLAAKLWNTPSPLGRQLGLRQGGGPPHFVNVVGVAPDLRHASPRDLPRPYLYLPVTQNYSGLMNVILRTSGTPRPILVTAARTIRNIEPLIPIASAMTGPELRAQSMAAELFGAWLMSALSAFALVLSAVGLYGTLQAAVAQRTRAIAIEVALGAGPWALGMKLARNHLACLVAGCSAGGLAFPWIQSGLTVRMSLSNPQPVDLLTVLAAAALLTLVGVAGCAMPMARVATCEPSRVLRSE
ncbi:ABC transporter permease [Paludibaculum fermentans]|uniref:ABC transporter permease n=1 Tax=Paludibaculum fermentans TaxID=1473598 RepID=A0A7S7NWA2_PALFE|nr:ABC transporter permease [Paludibaculum fermentans]QOY90957.1 ABC transporter permease [Paludibaculum fermentans]